jgi:hypothetical protein
MNLDREVEADYPILRSVVYGTKVPLFPYHPSMVQMREDQHCDRGPGNPFGDDGSARNRKTGDLALTLNKAKAIRTSPGWRSTVQSKILSDS